MTGDKRLDDQDGATATPHDGKVDLALWLKDRGPGGPPMHIILTPGQALEMCAQLARAAARALLKSVSP